MGFELLGGYVVTAALFYAFVSKTAPLIEELDETTVNNHEETEVIELFPATVETRKAA